MALAVGLGTLLLPVALNDAQLTVYIFIGLSTVVVAGLSLLMGYAGQVSLGQGAFYAIGAYAAALLARRLGVPPVLCVAAAGVLTAAVAMVVGLPLLRLRGHYLAFATLAFQLIVLSVIGQTPGLTGGDTGFTDIPPLSIGTLTLQGQYGTFAYAYVVWVLAAAALLFNRNLIRSRPGRALRALASSESGALAAGVPVGRVKLQVFALSALYAGLAGGLLAFFVGYIAPGTFQVPLSIEFLIMATVGGLGSVGGALVGASLVYLLVQGLSAAGTLPGMPSRAPEILSYAAYGLILVVILLVIPQGLVPALRSRLATARPDRVAEATG
ncbi:MAG: branched-chain amino acid ABC transporter permease [Candidatus Dormibacteraeota bacterium]|nr:branched-chain amino acid ABC transporter permease [Candidatus Dormibacteraeota bacterium]